MPRVGAMTNGSDLEAELRARLRLRSFPEFHNLRLWLAHSGSGLGDLAERWNAGAPYWGFPWPGGLALAGYLVANPDRVQGRHVVDFGAGCGLVGITAHYCGAKSVSFLETDALAAAAARLNAGENGLEPADLTLETLAPSDVVLAGDMFYDADVASRSLARLSALTARGIDVLIGDPYRPDLPVDHLVELARTDVREVGASETALAVTAGVFALRSDA